MTNIYINIINSVVPHTHVPVILAATLITLALVAFLNSGYLVGYVIALLLTVKQKTSMLDDKVDRCIDFLGLARFRFELCAELGLAAFICEVDELLADLRRLRDDTTNDNLYNLVEAKAHNLKFQFETSLLLLGNAHIDPIKYVALNNLDDAALAIRTCR